jgi:CDP-6-deoxy-D-xylo-4-hexulose-3-dehydrase
VSRERIEALVRDLLQVDPQAAVPADRLPLAVPPFGSEEVVEAIEALLEGQVTMGARVREFEAAFASHTGTAEAVMVNSGSSALLVMLEALIETGRLSRGDEVLLPAVGWSTDLFSLSQAGLVPVLVDVDPRTLCIEGEHDRPVLAVHLLGCPSAVRTPLLLEDACAAHGAEIGGQRVGSRGLCGVFSFFFSHHITTGEGGMITTSDSELADAARSLRAHGWVRERSDRARLEAAHPETDPRFLFVSRGFNLRPTEIAGAFGIHQLNRLDDFVAHRRANHRSWCEHIDSLGLPIDVFPEPEGRAHAGFAFPILLHADAPLDRSALCARLEARGIQTRPISGSNLARQPAAARVPELRIEGSLKVADAIHERGFFTGQSHAFGSDQLELLAESLSAALAG